MDSIEENFSKHFSREENKVAIALWKAKVPLKTVREQCKESEDQGDQETLDHPDGQLRVLEEAHGWHAQEAGGGFCKAGCLH